MNIIQKVFVEPFQKCYENMLYFIPNLLTFFMLLIAGIVIGYIIKIIFSRVLKAVKLDKFAERSGIFEVMSKGGVKEPPSIIVAKLIGWLTVLTFIVIAFQALKIPTVEHLLERFFLYLPNIFVAVVILMVGYLLSNFFGRAALIALVNAGTKNAGMISKFTRFTVFVLSATMALEQLGIGRDTVIIAFTIIFGGVVLAGAIACGLGGKDIARDYLEKKMKEDDKKDEIHHL
jgi:uncharacterized membrane protein YwzB